MAVKTQKLRLKARRVSCNRLGVGKYKFKRDDEGTGIAILVPEPIATAILDKHAKHIEVEPATESVSVKKAQTAKERLAAAIVDKITAQVTKAIQGGADAEQILSDLDEMDLSDDDEPEPPKAPEPEPTPDYPPEEPEAAGTPVPEPSLAAAAKKKKGKKRK